MILEAAGDIVTQLLLSVTGGSINFWKIIWQYVQEVFKMFLVLDPLTHYHKEIIWDKGRYTKIHIKVCSIITRIKIFHMSNNRRVIKSIMAQPYDSLTETLKITCLSTDSHTSPFCELQHKFVAYCHGVMLNISLSTQQISERRKISESPIAPKWKTV